MGDMTYTRDVRPYGRHWLVTFPVVLDTKLELVKDDKLVFEGDGDAGTGTISKHRSGMRYGDWCKNCSYDSTNDKITGTHTSTGGTVVLTFARAAKSTHSATVTYPGGTGTWMADEGP